MALTSYELGAAFAGWATLDPCGARAAWEEIYAGVANHPMIQDATSMNARVQRAISSTWSAESPRESWDYLRANLAELPFDWIEGWIDGLGEGAPWAQIASELQSLSDQRLAGSTPEFAAQWARQEPEAAVAWVVAASPQSLETMFEVWCGTDTNDQALAWLQQNNAGLAEEVRIAALRAALTYHSDHTDELLPLLGDLPRTDATWTFLRDLAAGRVPADNPFANRFEADHLRALVETLQPPEEIRKQIEASLADATE